MFSSVSSFGLTGIACYPVTVEADVSRAFPCFEIVGLPDAAVKESKDRVRSAMKNCGMEFPSSRVVVNLAPADTKKTGAIYDLPILVGILCSTGALPPLPEGLALVGELSLDGHLRPVNGILSMVADARRGDCRHHNPPGQCRRGSGVPRLSGLCRRLGGGGTAAPPG